MSDEPTGDTVSCVRCGQESAALPAPPFPGPGGAEIQRKICPDCWAEWQHAEVMVINELKLNFMDPRSLEVLEHHMREFLTLSPPSDSSGGGEPGPASEAP